MKKIIHHYGFSVFVAVFVVVAVATMAFVVLFPDGNGILYTWLLWVPFPLFYMGEHPPKYLFNVFCCFGAGCVWNLVCTFIYNLIPNDVLTLVASGLLSAVMTIVHMIFLAKTPFNCVSAVFLANLLCLWDSHGVVSLAGEPLPPLGNHIVFLILAIGCLCVLIMNLMMYGMMSKLCSPQPEQAGEQKAG